MTYLRKGDYVYSNHAVESLGVEKYAIGIVKGGGLRGGVVVDFGEDTGGLVEGRPEEFGLLVCQPILPGICELIDLVAGDQFIAIFEDRAPEVVTVTDVKLNDKKGTVKIKTKNYYIKDDKWKSILYV